MKNLYAKVVLFFIKPALELHLYKTKGQRYKETDSNVLSAVLMDKNSAISTALESVYGLTRVGR